MFGVWDACSDKIEQFLIHLVWHKILCRCACEMEPCVRSGGCLAFLGPDSFLDANVLIPVL